MAWLGWDSGCSIYYFITSWLVGLSNYLVVCLICLLLVKRAASVLARLQECWFLLVSVIVITVLPAIPELFIRATISAFGHGVCILATQDFFYGLYITFKLLLRHLAPAILILLCRLRPQTVAAKRISLIFLGQHAVCECGPSGSELAWPHECPKIARNPLRPDILRDTEGGGGVDQTMLQQQNVQEKSGRKGIPALLEDPVRRRYKTILALSFLTTSTLYILVDIIFQVCLPSSFLLHSSILCPQIQSAVTRHYLTSTPLENLGQMSESLHEANLATALYIFIFAQQIINPIIFLYTEFRKE